MPYDGSKVGLRELSKSSSHTLPVASPNGKQQDSSSPRAQRNSNSSSSRFTFSQLLSRQYGIFWLVWLLLLGVFLIRHTTKLLDAAGQQHYLLAPPTAATAAPATHAGSTQQQQKQAAQHHDSTQAAGSQVASTFVSSSSSSTGAEAILAAQRSKWPHGYIAVCAVIKDQWPDLRYWIEYHRCAAAVTAESAQHTCVASSFGRPGCVSGVTLHVQPGRSLTGASAHAHAQAGRAATAAAAPPSVHAVTHTLLSLLFGGHLQVAGCVQVLHL